MPDPIRSHDAAQSPIHWLDIVNVRHQRASSLYQNGWGDRAAFGVFWDEVRHRREPAAVAPSLRSRRVSLLAAREYEGEFRSPVPFLPPESAHARVRVYLPAGRVHGVCVHLGALGEHSFARRMWLTRSLLKDRIGAVLLETPYHGSRRLTRQSGIGPRCVADQMWLGAAVISETAALLAWLRADGFRVALSGFSMGASLAAYTAVRLPWPIDLVVAGGPVSPADVATQGLLRRLVCWDALGGASDGVIALQQAFDAVALSRLGPPVDATRAHLIGYQRDGIVPPASVRAHHRHWPGSRATWIDTGHVGGFLGSHRTLGDGIRRALDVAGKEAA